MCWIARTLLRDSFCDLLLFAFMSIVFSPAFFVYVALFLSVNTTLNTLANATLHSLVDEKAQLEEEVKRLKQGGRSVHSLCPLLFATNAGRQISVCLSFFLSFHVLFV